MSPLEMFKTNLWPGKAEHVDNVSIWEAESCIHGQPGLHRETLSPKGGGVGWKNGPVTKNACYSDHKEQNSNPSTQTTIRESCAHI